MLHSGRDMWRVLSLCSGTSEIWRRVRRLRGGGISFPGNSSTKGTQAALCEPTALVQPGSDVVVPGDEQPHKYSDRRLRDFVNPVILGVHAANRIRGPPLIRPRTAENAGYRPFSAVASGVAKERQNRPVAYARFGDDSASTSCSIPRGTSIVSTATQRTLTGSLTHARRSHISTPTERCATECPRKQPTIYGKSATRTTSGLRTWLAGRHPTECAASQLAERSFSVEEQQPLGLGVE